MSVERLHVDRHSTDRPTMDDADADRATPDRAPVENGYAADRPSVDNGYAADRPSVDNDSADRPPVEQANGEHGGAPALADESATSDRTAAREVSADEPTYPGTSARTRRRPYRSWPSDSRSARTAPPGTDLGRAGRRSGRR
ncbi:hypothetical protein NKG94_12060 [Micromonospora sp. M12]